MALSQLIEIELINQKELKDVCECVHDKIYKMTQAVPLLESMITSMRSLEDFLSCCKAFMTMHNSLCEAIHAIQNYSIVSSRVQGLEMGHWRIRLPFFKWLNFSFATFKKKKLDSLLQELENVFERCVILQNSLITLGAGFSGQTQLNVMDLLNQDEWSCEIMMKKMEKDEIVNTLTMAKEWNLDSLLILRNLIEWDYKHRFSVGESSNGDETDNELTSLCIETSESNESHFLYGTRPLYQGSLYNNVRNHRTKRYLIFSVFFVSIFLIFVAFAR